MKRFLAISMFLFAVLTIGAEETLKMVYEVDSATISPYAIPTIESYGCKQEQFKAKQLILPLSLLTVGTTGLIKESPLDNLSRIVRKGMNYRSVDFHIDDWIQFMPVVMHVGMGCVGVKAKHNVYDRCVVAATSYACMALVSNVMKHSVRERRPDASTRNSFPSGHTATAFTGAELVRIEYGNYYGAAAYTVAVAVGVLRVCNDRHWTHDVIAGAGIGILSARVGYWMLPVWKRLFGKKKEVAPAMSIVPLANPSDNSYGLTTAMVF